MERKQVTKSARSSCRGPLELTRRVLRSKTFQLLDEKGGEIEYKLTDDIPAAGAESKNGSPVCGVCVRACHSLLGSRACRRARRRQHHSLHADVEACEAAARRHHHVSGRLRSVV